MSWILSALNSAQADTIFLCPNMIVNVGNEMSRKRKAFNFGSVKRLVLVLNVGKTGTGDVFIGTSTNPGCHWVLVVVDLRPSLKILYCDSMAWQAPTNIVDTVNIFTRHILHSEAYNNSHLVLAHCPGASSNFVHQCDWRCRNYSLQSCADICGVNFTC